ncbi:MAG: pirin family protein, partial [Bacteroidetes bacterium]|nr:pirin family protein [Bacteroidota bacterium]
MKRRDFIKGSAIIGASVAVPSFLHSCSAMFTQTGNRKIRSVLNMKKVNVGTLPVLRAFAGDHTDYVSPFVLFDEFGPVNITPGADALKVGAHPHAGVTPTTFFLDGSGHHKDSLDYDFQVNKGEFMMFNSGKGAIHMEESGEELKQNGGNLHGFQIWLNMPSKHKFDDPTTVVFKDEAMPTIVHRKFTAQVVLGKLFRRKSSIETLSPAFYYHIKLHADNRLDIPVDPTHNAFLYTVKGKLELEG